MADHRLRELERLAASGDVEARARLLCERVRADDLTAERLALAGYLGDEAAARAGEEPVSAARAENVVEWLVGLERWGERVGVRALLGLAERQRAERGGNFELDSAIDAARAWLDDPSPTRTGGGPLPLQSLWDANPVAGAMRLGFEEGYPGRPYWLASLVVAAMQLGVRDGEPDPTGAWVRATLREALVPWALASSSGELEP